MSLNIVIIDDDPSFRQLLKVRLKSFLDKPNITVFENLGEARQQLPKLNFDEINLVILDQHLPDGSGTELLTEGLFEDLAVLSVSSDDCPTIPGASVGAGAAFFMSKNDISEPLFEPLVKGIIDRNHIGRELTRAKLEAARIDTVKTLVGTLRHEINNPLGAVLGAAYLLQNNEQATKDQKRAAELVKSSGERIKHVLDELCKAIELESVNKADQTVFHIPGDEPWED